MRLRLTTLLCLSILSLLIRAAEPPATRPLEGHPGNVFLEGEAVTIKLPPGPATRWELIDIERKVVAASQADGESADLGRFDAIIGSMTPGERKNPEVINGSRRQRIARGSGTSVQDVNRLLKQFAQLRKMMKQFKGMEGKLPRMKNFPGLPGMPRG